MERDRVDTFIVAAVHLDQLMIASVVDFDALRCQCNSHMNAVRVPGHIQAVSVPMQMLNIRMHDIAAGGVENLCGAIVGAGCNELAAGREAGLAHAVCVARERGQEFSVLDAPQLDGLVFARGDELKNDHRTHFIYVAQATNMDVLLTRRPFGWNSTLRTLHKAIRLFDEPRMVGTHTLIVLSLPAVAINSPFGDQLTQFTASE